MAQSVTAGGSTTTTYYVAGLEEQANVSGGTSTLTKHFSVPGVISAVNVGGTLSFLASDGLGSMSEALSATSAAATSQQLFGPYGGLCYATGGMPTAKGYTGQYADVASSGLDYYGARYYDPLIGQFTSADSTADGLNRYGYVAGNPETATDPSGHRICDGGDGCGSDGGDGGDGVRLPPPPGGGGGSNGCHSEHQCSCGDSCISNTARYDFADPCRNGVCHIHIPGLPFWVDTTNSQPTDDQVSAAVNDARTAVANFGKLADGLSKLLTLLELPSVLLAKKQYRDFIGELIAATATLYANALVLQGLFTWEAGQARAGLSGIIH